MKKEGPIIIFEDDEDEIEFLKEVFKRLEAPNELLFFDDGEELLRYLKTTTDQPFLIISDVNLHKMNGLELRERVQQDDQLRKKSIPFIFLSTSAKRDVVAKAYDLTVQGYFKKQQSIPAIEKHIKLILDYWRQCKHPNSIGVE